MDTIVVCSLLVVFGWVSAWVVRDARRQARNCDTFFAQLRGYDSSQPLHLAWSSDDERALRRLLEAGER